LQNTLEVRTHWRRMWREPRPTVYFLPLSILRKRQH